MGKRVRLWIREDGEQPKAVARDADEAPGPGRLVDVAAPSADEARRLFRLAQASEPDRKKDKAGWLAWDEARDAVQEVTS